MTRASEDGVKSYAPLRNMALFNELVERVIGRASHLPGMACFYGHSGYGKTFSAIWAANRSRAYYVELGETWTRKTLCLAILRELGLGSLGHGALPDLVSSIVDRLAEERDRPLIIDEADFLAKKGMIDLVREIHDKSQAPVILIGEELLPVKLQKFERTHNRMLDWVAAVPADIQDTRHLARIYAAGAEIADDLLAAILKASDGRARRIAVNLDRVREKAQLKGRKQLSLAEWGDAPFFTGEPPRRRAA
ncbi:MAG: ATP-binding protein [Hyphomicrobiaceae bacterium]|nr:ATP-binding protein [Hyphomicrobiaceae bacterium]